MKSNDITKVTVMFNLVESCIASLSLYLQYIKNHTKGTKDNIIVNFSLSVISQSQSRSKIADFLYIFIHFDTVKFKPFLALYIHIINNQSNDVNIIIVIR